jgi:hypothetical protein
MFIDPVDFCCGALQKTCVMSCTLVQYLFIIKRKVMSNTTMNPSKHAELPAQLRQLQTSASKSAMSQMSHMLFGR